MTFTYQKVALNEEENFTSTTCNRQGKWDPDPAEFCAITSGTKQPQFVIAVAVYVVHKHYEIYTSIATGWGLIQFINYGRDQNIPLQLTTSKDDIL